MNLSLAQLTSSFSFDTITEERKEDLKVLIDYITSKKNQNKAIHLNFICTHNSRRSQFSQLWAKVMAVYHGVDCYTYSGGVEITACNERVIATLEEQGFEISTQKQDENPRYQIGKEGKDYGSFFSKLYDDPSSPSKDFAAVMTCAHADENCPYIPGAEQRIPLRYNDPKAFDDTPKEQSAYRDKSLEIALEMHYIFACVG